ncbi:glycosyltransferase family 2 protein [Pyruvatibacter sp.]|uniref:glycosyltransferase family 2 protein n=1 Tax=Pyruvatibacter sp. TaxID=1981328 RepID=UPI003264D729
MPDGTSRNGPEAALIKKDGPPLGKVLVDASVISARQLEQALEAATRWGVPLGQAVLALGFSKPLDLYSSLAAHLQLPFVDVLETPPPAAVFDAAFLDFYLAAEVIPIGMDDSSSLQRTVLATPDPLNAARDIAWRRTSGLPAPGGEFAFAITPRLDVLWTLQAQFGDQIQHTAQLALDETDPALSAKSPTTWRQRLWGSAIVGSIALGAFLNPYATFAVLNFLIGLFFLAVLILRAASIPIGVAARNARRPIDQLPEDSDLPIYTIIVPLYKEANVLPLLAQALRKLDYPRAKLDIKLVLEGDDTETIDTAKTLGLESYVEFIRVPESSPRTKPKACNYALQFARGEYLVIFDAEDQPDPLQLKKAVAMFATCDDTIACLQAPLTYFNASENWLTRQFTIEFNMWFDLLLPTVEKLGMPIPLGGTSTHFRMKALRDVGAWDPYNVTEDADLGIRLAQKGYRCAILDSVTYEEANCEMGNWLRQRSRWLKGYAQTWLVHMRRPVDLFRKLGPMGFLGFQLLIGGSIISALMHPLVWMFAVAGIAFNGSALAYFTSPDVPTLLVLFNGILLGGGYIVSVCAGIAAVQHRDAQHLVPHTFLMVFYWPLLSMGAYLALWQLFTRPSYWEKTHHAISKASRAQLAQLAHRRKDSEP